MKLFKNIAYSSLILLAFGSCDLADPITSEITEYADFTMEGESFIYHQVGTPFTDPGVTAMEGEDDLEVQVTGSVDPNVIGVYYLNYSAVNSDGFSASVERVVAVGDQEVAFNRDLSGTYVTGGRPNVVTMTGPGVYLNSDTLPFNSISVWMVDLGNGQLVIPPQSTPFGTVYADPSLNPSSLASISEDGVTLIINQFISCCGIFSRTFLKQ